MPRWRSGSRRTGPVAQQPQVLVRCHAGLCEQRGGLLQRHRKLAKRLGELPGFQVIDSPHQPRTLAAFAAKCRSQGKIHDRYRHVLIASATGYSSHCLMSSCNDITG